MPGSPITRQQRELYMSHRQQGLSQQSAAAKAGFSERTARRIEQSPNPTSSSAEPSRHWRTRKDPFADIWDDTLRPMLERDAALSALTLWEYLDERFPGQYPGSTLRTLQRRVAAWRTQHGPEREVIFRQQAVPGLMGLSDFSHPNTPITINGQPFPHLLYQFRLHYSGWRSISVVQGGESYSALASSLQRALAQCGGAPHEHRTDSLSAARANTQNRWSEQYEQLCSHYAMRPTRNNPGKSHENGAVECAHGSFKRRLEQTLRLRGSTDFDSVEGYQRLIDQVAQRLNRRVQERFTQERSTLQPLPERRFCDFQILSVRVTRSSTMELKRVTYSVPSRLIGQRLRVHLYHDHLEGFVQSQRVFTLDRVYAPKSGRARSVDFRHLIHSLAAKPQAFRGAALRDDILPSATYRALWQAVDESMEAQQACKWMVSVLRIAAQMDDIEAFGQALLHAAQDDTLPSRDTLLERYLPRQQPPKQSQLRQHTLADYDQYLQHHHQKPHHPSTAPLSVPAPAPAEAA